MDDENADSGLDDENADLGVVENADLGVVDENADLGMDVELIEYEHADGKYGEKCEGVNDHNEEQQSRR